MKKTLILTLILTLIALSLFAQAGKNKRMNQKGRANTEMNRPMPDRPMMRMHRAQNMMDALNLTPEQMKQMRSARIEHMKRMNLAQAELRNLRMDKNAALQEQKFDDAKRLTDQITQKQAQIQKAEIDMQAANFNMLNEQQKEIYKQYGPIMQRGRGDHNLGSIGNTRCMAGACGMIDDNENDNMTDMDDMKDK